MTRNEALSCFALVFTLLLSGCATTQQSPKLRSVSVEGAPKAVGPYSQGIVANGLLYTAGQTPRDPATGNQVGGDISAQTNRVLDNLEAILKGAGCTLQDVVRVTVFMTDLNDFAKMNEAYGARFAAHKPARTTVQVSKLPGNAQLEIDLVAMLPK